jgi:2-polyprenyl-3-methyl-5-hydroxy-6-metoxy-1,4-benzoquinol methylase
MNKDSGDINEILSEIEDSIIKDNTVLSDWNVNYFKQQKERYISDINYLSELKDINSVLEIGAAPFHLTACLQKLGYDITVLDLDPSRFSDFVNKFDLNIENCNIETDQLNPEKKFDLILLTEVFEHLRINPQETLSKLYNSLNDDGYFYLTTPNFYKITNVTDFLKGKGVANGFHQFNKLNTIGHMGHVREYTRNEVNLFLESVGFKVIDFKYKNSKKFPLLSKQNIASSLSDKFKSHMMFLCKKA